MKSPPRILRVLFALLGYSSVHWAAGRWRRALAWDALLLALFVAIVYVPVWLLVAILIAQIVDGALIEPARSRSTGMYAIAALIALCTGVLVQTTLRTRLGRSLQDPGGLDDSDAAGGRSHLGLQDRAHAGAR